MVTGSECCFFTSSHAGHRGGNFSFGSKRDADLTLKIAQSLGTGDEARLNLRQGSTHLPSRPWNSRHRPWASGARATARVETLNTATCLLLHQVPPQEAVRFLHGFIKARSIYRHWCQGVTRMHCPQGSASPLWLAITLVFVGCGGLPGLNKSSGGGNDSAASSPDAASGDAAAGTASGKKPGTAPTNSGAPGNNAGAAAPIGVQVGEVAPGTGATIPAAGGGTGTLPAPATSPPAASLALAKLLSSGNLRCLSSQEVAALSPLVAPTSTLLSQPEKTALADLLAKSSPAPTAGAIQPLTAAPNALQSQLDALTKANNDLLIKLGLPPLPSATLPGLAGSVPGTGSGCKS